MTSARILDRGYRRYLGRRRGVPGAVRTVVLNSIQRALGLRRSAWAKVLPIGFVLLAYVPAIVYIGLVSLLPETTTQRRSVHPGRHPAHLWRVPGLRQPARRPALVALVAPEILLDAIAEPAMGSAGTRASPRTREWTRRRMATATAAVRLPITIGPTLLMLVAFIIQGEGPDGPWNVLLTAFRIVGSGLVITAIYTGLSMGVSSLTDRKAFATVGLILLFFLSNVVTRVLTEGLGLNDRT